MKNNKLIPAPSGIDPTKSSDHPDKFTLAMAAEVWGAHCTWTEAQIGRLKAFEAFVRADERTLAAPVQVPAAESDPLIVKLKDAWRTDDWGNPIIYDTDEIDEVTHALTGDEGEEDSLTVLNSMAAYVSTVWPGKTALQVLIECEEAMALTPSAAQPADKAQIEWPKTRDVGRYGDMSPSAHLRVGLDSDNDVYLSVWDENGGASIEFCNPGGGGGGTSGTTRMALIALMVAMEQDNAMHPEKDWWARRMKGGAA